MPPQQRLVPIREEPVLVAAQHLLHAVEVSKLDRAVRALRYVKSLSHSKNHLRQSRGLRRPE